MSPNVLPFRAARELEQADAWKRLSCLRICAGPIDRCLVLHSRIAAFSGVLKPCALLVRWIHRCELAHQAATATWEIEAR